jgi:hypothetical protein
LLKCRVARAKINESCLPSHSAVCARSPFYARTETHDARLYLGCRSGFWSGRRMGRSDAVRCMNSEALSARVHVVKGHVALSAWALNHSWCRAVGRDHGPVHRITFVCSDEA